MLSPKFISVIFCYPQSISTAGLLTMMLITATLFNHFLHNFHRFPNHFSRQHSPNRPFKGIGLQLRISLVSLYKAEKAKYNHRSLNQ
jgi:hypothetical protein